MSAVTDESTEQKVSRQKWPKSAKITVWTLAGFTLLSFMALGDTESVNAQQVADEARTEAEEGIEEELEEAIAEAEEDAYDDGYDDGMEEGSDKAYDRGFEEGKAESVVESADEFSMDDYEFGDDQIASMFEIVFWKNWEGMTSSDQSGVCDAVEFMPEMAIDAYLEGWHDNPEALDIDRRQVLSLFQEACGL